MSVMRRMHSGVFKDLRPTGPDHDGREEGGAMSADGWEQAAPLQLDPEVKANDSYARDRARKMANALYDYSSCMHHALIAESDGDPRSAEGHRAEARAHLHPYPWMLEHVEPS